MKILFVNTTCGIGSHGRICGELAEEYERKGHQCRIAYGRGCSDKYKRFGYKIGNKLSILFNVLATRLFDAHGYLCFFATKKFLMWAEKFNPELLWLHNIHGYYINYKMLFDWIKKRPNMKVKWTLHDAWAFTGHCGVFITANCFKWKTECNKCSLLRDYPKCCFLDGSRRNYRRKKSCFTGVPNLTVITPSDWLANEAKKSFLKEYYIQVIHNKVDRKIFRHIDSDFKKKYSIEDKVVILGVANVWSELKGLYDFIQLASMLDDNYVIVLVGFTTKQIVEIPKSIKGMIKIGDAEESGAVYTMLNQNKTTSKEIMGGLLNNVQMKASDRKGENNVYGIAIPQDVNKLYDELIRYTKPYIKTSEYNSCKVFLLPKTENITQLVCMYSMADVFVNPTHGDNFPTTNLEAIACGTYVITYDVGGARETISGGNI